MAPEIAVSLRADEGRAEAFRFLNGEFLFKVTSKDTSGRLMILDTLRQARGGPPMHVHEVEHEWFYVTEGVFDISIGGKEHRLEKGDSVLGPAGVPHAFTNVTETGRILVAFTPAGRMEEFFRESAAISTGNPQDFAKVFPAYGMTVVGPPLPVRES